MKGFYDKLLKDCTAEDIILAFDKYYRYDVSNNIDTKVIKQFMASFTEAIKQIKANESTRDLSNDDLIKCLNFGFEQSKPKLENTLLYQLIKVPEGQGEKFVLPDSITFDVLEQTIKVE